MLQRADTEYAVEFAASILQCILQLVTFLGVLWTLSGDFRVTLFGAERNIPGYMVWCAVAYALIGSLLKEGATDEEGGQLTMQVHAEGAGAFEHGLGDDHPTLVLRGVPQCD